MRVSPGLEKVVTNVVNTMIWSLIILGTVAFAAVIMAFPTKWLWNYVVPTISNGALPEITAWQALGLYWLCGLLFKSTTGQVKQQNG